MKENFNRAPFNLSGRWQYRFRVVLKLCWSLFSISIRRLFRGARFPNWSFALETSTFFAKKITSTAFDLPDISDGREYEDSFAFASPALTQIKIEPITEPVKGCWFQPKSAARQVTVLYLHGGGYVYYSKVHRNLIAQVTLAAESRTFALDYRLIPEHPFPAQLEDALAAYRWLLQTGVSAQRLVVMGDSAGGNLALALLLALKDSREKLPALAVCLSPWTDLSNSGESMTLNEGHDFIEKRMPIRWAEWYCKDTTIRNPLASPINADLSGLPPIYIQAGTAEILHDMICEFAEKAKQQGVLARLEIWQNMPHDFPAFGDITTESKEALKRIGEVVREFVP